ncbi:MAG: 1-deoxy-D-xylulose-5-phosphate reductoisomerase, partial [Bacteroidales bacterium]|nr:1-deoxy-D-xylulose-5-phosphate reductoisomerase [Bacteroidales bacterium]
MEKRRLAILGSTGSIGRQALDVVRQHPDRFSVELLTANNNADLLIRQAIETDANAVVIRNESLYPTVSEALQPRGIKVFTGMDSICSLAAGDNIDMVLTALVGFSGLKPTLAAIRAGKPIALANNETLVAGGPVVMDLVRKNNIPLLPVDSEHSAIFQCLLGAAGNHIRKIHLTASGGPFRTWDKAAI